MTDYVFEMLFDSISSSEAKNLIYDFDIKISDNFFEFIKTIRNPKMTKLKITMKMAPTMLFLAACDSQLEEYFEF